MSRGPSGSGDLEFLQAVMKQGFVNIPRILLTYTGDLGLDYAIIGKIVVVMASLGGPNEVPFGSHVISCRANPDFEQLRSLISDLEDEEIVMSEDEGDHVSFTFAPLFARLRAIWAPYREQYEEELKRGGSDPALAAAERLFARPLSSREMADIQDWVTSFGFDAEMVQAVIQEGKRQGVTRMTYLNTIARQWHEEGVRTPEEAELYVQRYRKAAGKHRSIIQYLGFTRQLTKAEQGLLDKWTEDWGFSNEVIIRACEEAAGKQNPLQYVNRVLDNWRERSVKTVADVEELQSQFKRRSIPAAAETAAASDNRRRKAPPKSNVFLQREKKDEDYYDYIFKKFDK